MAISKSGAKNIVLIFGVILLLTFFASVLGYVPDDVPLKDFVFHPLLLLAAFVLTIWAWFNPSILIGPITGESESVDRYSALRYVGAILWVLWVISLFA